MMKNNALQLSRQWLRELGPGSVRLTYHPSLPVALISLDHPARHNALTGKMMAELADCIDTLEEHKNKLAALILNGVPPSFCSGIDLHLIQKHLNTPESAKRVSFFMQDTLTRMSRLPLISFSAIEGNAIGGGAELATATDFRVVTFGSLVRFVHFKLGASTIFGGASRLERLIGYPKALQLFLSCKKLDGDACYKLGLAQWVCNSGGALSTCLDVIEGYLDVPRPEELTLEPGEGKDVHAVDWLHQDAPYHGRSLASLKALKANLLKSQDPLATEREGLEKCWGSEEHLKAVKAAL